MDLRNGNNDEVLEYMIMHFFKAPLTRQAWDLDSKLKCVSDFVTKWYCTALWFRPKITQPTNSFVGFLVWQE